MGHRRRSLAKLFSDTGNWDLFTLASVSSHSEVASPPLDGVIQLHVGKNYIPKIPKNTHILVDKASVSVLPNQPVKASRKLMLKLLS